MIEKQSSGGGEKTASSVPGSIKYIQQIESEIRSQIYFTAEFQELLQNFWETQRLFSRVFKFTCIRTHRLRNKPTFYTKQDFLPISFSRPTLSTVDYSSGYLLFISCSTICFWIDWVRVKNSRKPMASIREKLHHCQRAKNEHGVSFQSSPTICMHAYHNTHLHRMKVCNTRPVCLTIEVFLIKILLFFDHWSIHLFQSNQHFQAIIFIDRTRSGKARHLSLPKLSSQNMQGALENF